MAFTKKQTGWRLVRETVLNGTFVILGAAAWFWRPAGIALGVVAFLVSGAVFAFYMPGAIQKYRAMEGED